MMLSRTTRKHLPSRAVLDVVEDPTVLVHFVLPSQLSADITDYYLICADSSAAVGLVHSWNRGRASAGDVKLADFDLAEIESLGAEHDLDFSPCLLSELRTQLGLAGQLTIIVNSLKFSRVDGLPRLAASNG